MPSYRQIRPIWSGGLDLLFTALSQSARSTMTTIITQVSLLPPLLPILLWHHQQGQTRISLIRPPRPAVIHQLQPPPQLHSIPQPATVMEEGLRLFQVDWWVHCHLFLFILLLKNYNILCVRAFISQSSVNTTSITPSKRSTTYKYIR